MLVDKALILYKNHIHRQLFPLRQGHAPLLSQHTHGRSPGIGLGRRWCDHRNRRQPMAHRIRSEEHTSELQSRGHLVCRLLLEKKKREYKVIITIVKYEIYKQ